MDMYTVKLKLMTLISESDSELTPQETHVIGDMFIPSYKLSANKYPIVTVKIFVTPSYVYGNKTPSLACGELYNYDFVAYVFATELIESRRLGDKIIDYLKINNKHSDTNIIDIINLGIQEAPTKHGAKALWRVEIRGTVITEESII